MTADQIAARTGARQHGLLTLGQARAAGLTDRQVRSRIAAGRLTPVRPRVYRFAGVRPSWEAEVLAAVLSAGRRAVASHATAAALLGLGRVESCGRIEVTVLRPDNPRGLGGVLVHRSVRLDPADACGVRGVPCTSAARTVIDLAARLDPDPLRALVDDVLYDELARRNELHRRAVTLARGRGGVEVVVGLTRPGAEEAFRSWLEREAARVMTEAGVPSPRWNQPVADRHGKVGAVDAQWPEARLVVELDGLRFHRTEQQRRADRARDRRLGLAGYLVLRFTWSDVRTRPAMMVAQVREGLAR